jgi:hypothetical protein
MPYTYAASVVGTEALINHDLPVVDTGYLIAIQHIALGSSDSVQKTCTLWKWVVDRFYWLGLLYACTVVKASDPYIPWYLHEGERLRIVLPNVSSNVTISILIEGWIRRVGNPDESEV